MSRLRPVYGTRFYLLLPERPVRQPGELLRRLQLAAELWGEAYGYFDGEFHRLAAALLYRYLAGEDEFYSEDPRAWYYGALAESYPGIVDRTAYSRRGVEVYIGDIRIRKVKVYCGPRECWGYTMFDATRETELQQYGQPHGNSP